MIPKSIMINISRLWMMMLMRIVMVWSMELLLVPYRWKRDGGGTKGFYTLPPKTRSFRAPSERSPQAQGQEDRSVVAVVVVVVRSSSSSSSSSSRRRGRRRRRRYGLYGAGCPM